MVRRAVALCFIASLIAAQQYGPARAQEPFPTRPVKLLVPYPGGGSNDVLARIVADKLQAKWGQPIVIENRTGAGGNIAAAYVAQAEPDGYTLLVSASPPLAINQSSVQAAHVPGRGFHPDHGFRGGAEPGHRPQGPAGQLGRRADRTPEAESRQAGLRQPGQRQYPAPDRQHVHDHDRNQHIHVPYRGETLVLNDMLGGRVDVFFGNISGSLALYRDGKVKVLAVTDKARASAIPEVPTTAEAGLPDLVSVAWYAMVAPPKLSPRLQEQIAAATVETLKMPDVQQKFRALNVEPGGGSPAVTAAFIREEMQRWGDVIRKNNIVGE